MALWTPADRLTEPKAWIRARSGTYSGSTLTAITNDGTGGSGPPTISGTVVKGATMNGKDTLRLEGGNTIGIPMNAWGSGGKLFAIAVYKSLYSSGERAFFQASPAWGSTGALGVYAADFAGDLWSAADGYNGYGGGGGSGPYWYGGPGPPRQTLLMQSWFFGPSNTKTRVNAVDQTPTFTVNGSVPNYDPGTYRLGEVTGGEAANSDFAEWAAFDDIPPDLAEWDGWLSWEYAGDGSLLPVGHPYKDAPPTTGTSVVWNPVAPTSASWTAQSATGGTWTPVAPASSTWTAQ